ncbi:uncharacterized protein LOC142665547 [Rhinoderma darwinii]|uniref:uncharacterized protein LOC142665547 n=1 Tax=Rhinoderma darwinii TaxID=43563 RepID=UPI003F663878
MATAILREELSCSICLNIYTDPVILRCGHNFCQDCIDRMFGTRDRVGVYSCPECREEFQERPDLPRNIILCNIIERCIISQPEERVEGIFCTYCVHSPVDAIKSCLHCEASLCEDHLLVHSKSPEHVLSEPSNCLQNRKCSVHKKILEYYCTQDASCICVTCCLAGEHTGHKVEQLMEASNRKKRTLKTILTKLLAKRTEVENRVQTLQELRAGVQKRATGVTDTVIALFRDLRKQLEDLGREEQASLSVSDLMKQLEIKKEELTMKMSYIERLCNTTDPLIVLKELESDREDFCDTEKADNDARQAYNEKIQNIGGLDEGLMSVTLHTGLADIVSSVKVGVIVEKALDLVLDVSTASNRVNISNGYKSIIWSEYGSNWPSTPERFQMYPQVLSIKPFSSGKNFMEWEFNSPKSGGWSVGMCYPSIERTGNCSCLGFNNKSWCLQDPPNLGASFYRSPAQSCDYVEDEAGSCCVVGGGDQWEVTQFHGGRIYPYARNKEYQLIEDPNFHFHFFRLLSIMASADLREELTCSICLNIFTDPVTLRCGHNFCLVCIDRVWETQEGLGVYSCPDCRARFTVRPTLQGNVTLRNIAEHFLYFRPEDVEGVIFCTNCINSPVPAVKSCLHCEASLCDNHLRVHSKSPDHVLCEPTATFSNRKCSVHNEVLKYYCSSDRTCICVTCCLAGDHSGHKVDPLIKASQKKKATLKNIRKNLSTLSNEAEERLQKIQKRQREVQEKASGIKAKVANLFTDMKRQLVILENKVQAEISRQENQVFDLIRQLEIQKNELSLVMCHIEELCNMTDPLTLLQECVSVQFRHSEETGNDDQDDGDKGSYVGDMDEGLISETLHTGLSDIMTFVKRQIYVKENRCTNLDEDTVANNLLLSIDKKAVFWTQKLPDLGLVELPVRFQNCSQVLSMENFSTGRHYWDVEASKHGEWRLGVSYSTIERGGDRSYLGCNDKSWCLCRSNNKQYSVVYDNREIKLSPSVSQHKFRIYLDYYGARVSFYELCTPIRHLYTFTAEFTQPLHLAFYVCGVNTFVRIGY